jgi:hypothetical protein
MPRNVKGGSVEGKNCLCWNCSKEFVLDIDAMSKVRPWCQACRLVAAGMSPDTVAEFLVQKELEHKKVSDEKALAESKVDTVKTDKDGNEIEVFDPLS